MKKVAYQVKVSSEVGTTLLSKTIGWLALCTFFLSLCISLPCSVFAADKLIVKDPSGVNTKFVVTDDGKVGIGTGAPSRNLDVSGGVPIMQNSGTAGFDFKNTGATFGASVSVGTAGNPNLYANWLASTNSRDDATKVSWGVRMDIGGDRFRVIRAPIGDTFADLFNITGNGSVGIGTASPTQLLDINSNGIRIRNSKTPSSSSDTCNQGDMAWDSGYVYVCVATNSWKRANLSSW
jgi:hypothetical protein